MEINTEFDDELTTQYLVFEVEETFAIELSKASEVLEMLPLTKVPETPEHIAGVINLRGSVIPVIDSHIRFKKNPEKSSAYQCIIILKFQDMQIGLIVDSVKDIISIDKNSIADPPHMGKSYSYVFIKGIGIIEEHMYLILDVDKLININDIDFNLV